jgi:hypothetical protein
MSLYQLRPGHLVTQQLAIEQIESQTFLPPDATLYNWTAFKNPAGDFMLWMVNPNDPAEVFTVTPGTEPAPRSGEPPADIDGYQQIPSTNYLGGRYLH